MAGDLEAMFDKLRPHLQQADAVVGAEFLALEGADHADPAKLAGRAPPAVRANETAPALGDLHQAFPRRLGQGGAKGGAADVETAGEFMLSGKKIDQNPQRIASRRAAAA